jgi:ABC-2 type transport system permease protein
MEAKAMKGTARYLRLLLAFGRYGLTRELAFRGNFLVKITVEVLWLILLLVFYTTVFTKTSVIAGWSEHEYLFFVGCYFALEGVMETFFMSNCSEFADLVRSGDLDFILLKPIDEQFLVSCRGIEWSSAPTVLMGSGVMATGLAKMGWTFDPLQGVLFVLLFACGVAIAYGFLLLLTSTSVWFMRNQSLWELWWLFTSLMRYPKEIFAGRLAAPLGWFFTFIVPVLIVVNVPARVMAKRLFDPAWIAFTVLTAVVLLYVSRRIFRAALRRYRSASS